MVVRCLDTYALVEISEANPLFMKYLQGDFVVPEVILAEFFGVLLRRFGKQTANYWFNKIKSYTVPVQLDIIREAIEFRHENKKKGISFFDAAGYMLAVKKGYVFVTGDKEFKDLKHVEYVK